MVQPLRFHVWGQGARLRSLRVITDETARETVGTSGPNNAGGRRQVQFSGRTIPLTGNNGGGLARRTTIEFNENFTTCDVHIIFAKQAGSDVVIGSNLATGGAALEIRSSTVTGVSCSVRDGNVFVE
jgi:hypothetical protein